MRTSLLAPAAAAACLLTACSSSQPAGSPGVTPSAAASTPVATSSKADPSAKASGHEVHFGYHGEVGPEHWGTLDAGWAACAKGRAQSPVDLGTVRGADLPDPALAYQSSNWTVVNTGHAVMVSPAAGSRLDLAGQAWTLKQFHFHTPSEHVVGGKPAAGELHLVHSDAKGRLLVVGALVTDQGSDNPAYDWITKDLPREVGKEEPVAGGQRNPRDLLPRSTAHRLYQGSLTTPPCTEGVTWLVLDQPVALSKAQVARLHGVTGDNARPVQPLNGRVVQEDRTP